MEDHAYFMSQAIEIAKEEMLRNGAAPFGAIVVRKRTIVGQGVNEVINKCDPTSHGEIEAIRNACMNLKTWDLSDCILYTTCEPCEMCLAAMFWARINKIFYAATLDDCKELGFDLASLRRLVRSDLCDWEIPTLQLMHSESRALLDLWKKQPDFVSF